MVIQPQERRKKEEGKKKDLQKQTWTIKKMAIGTYIVVITLNVTVLNPPTKRYKLAEWIQKQDLYICCLQEDAIHT